MVTITGLFKQIKKFEKIDKVDLLNSFKNQFKTERERELLIEAIKTCNKKQSTIYIYFDKHKPAGLINLEFDKIQDLPVVSVGYLFVVKDYRKKKIINNITISQLLIFYTIKFIITQIQSFIQVRHLALYPDQQNKKLINHYLKIIPNSYKLKDKKEFWILMKVA
jgi:hypothetical protein